LFSLEAGKFPFKLQNTKPNRKILSKVGNFRWSLNISLQWERKNVLWNAPKLENFKSKLLNDQNGLIWTFYWPFHFNSSFPTSMILFNFTFTFQLFSPISFRIFQVWNIQLLVRFNSFWNKTYDMAYLES